MTAPEALLSRAIGTARSRVGAVTMYRLVLLGLAGLAVVALVESTLGLIGYPPLALLATLLSALLASYGSNRVIARLFGVVPHSESSLITGLLLFFIFPPSLHLLSVTGVILSAVLASASKYILAVRGRHIFNPAAAGAFLLTLTGFYFSGWWAGTPAMLPFVVVVAAVILTRLRRLGMALIFVATAASIMFVRSLAADIDWLTAAAWPFTSSPMIFFAGLMLSEPLTQPPLRWQRSLYAVLVGCLFSIPMHLGSVYIAPESALLIGNGLAFLVGQRQAIELTLQQRTQLTPSTLEFAFRSTGRLKFRAGQYLELTLPHRRPDNRGLRRVFSIASAPDSELLRISTRVPEQSSTFKQALVALPEGTVLTATSIAGDFLLPRDQTTPLLFIAGGIGITPFASQLAALHGDRRDVVLIYTVRDQSDIGYREVLEAAGARVFLVSREPLTDLPDHWTALTDSRVSEEVLAIAAPDIHQRDVHVSGPPVMVNDVADACRKLKARSVRTDSFSGY